ncbi:MAG: PorV/PorQ family protein [Erysipelotrichia bacterium]|nr:PorV/PorQ family protein [Candidatus Riflebacteria bacterium]NCB39350.1 PorV/PorQ family protein [Erysipelotrichia bacterium]
MKKVFKTLFLVALSVGTMSTAFAESAGRAGAYLKMGVGARALGMGSAFTAVADDSTASFWNPAGLARLDKAEASFMHADLTMDREYNFFNYAHLLKDKDGKNKGVVALSHMSFGVDGIPETKLATSRTDGLALTGDEPATDALGRYTPGSNVWIFGYFKDTEKNTFGSYARKLSDKLYGGVNVKYLSQELYTNSASAWGLDFGLLYENSEKTTIGLTLRDIGENLDWDTASGHSDKVPTTTTLGIAHKANDKLTLAADLNKVEDMEMKLFAGAEWWMQDYAALRVGSHDGDLTLGASFKLDTWRFDYSYADETLGDAHRISASKQF